MGTKKGLCPYCQTRRLDHRIFQVNPDASTCFCPNCMKEMNPKEAINEYNVLISEMLIKADDTLFVACDPSLAYHEYADVLEFEPNEAHALIGRILCLIYMGKTRKSYLKEASILLESTNYRGCDINTFVSFLSKIDFALNEYNEAINKKLTFKGYYYDTACLKLYWLHLYNIIKMKEQILKLFIEIKKNYVSQQNDQIIETLTISLQEKQNILALEAFITTGEGYKFDKIVDEKVYVEQTGNVVETRFSRYRLSTLDENDKSKHLISDEIFRDYTSIIRLQKISIFLWSLLYLCMAGSIAGIILMSSQRTFLILFIVVAALFFILGSVVLAMSIYWRAMLKKRKLRVN